ncbi:MAG: ATP synthase F0 subunit B [Patescibacteria group bacterium]
MEQLFSAFGIDWKLLIAQAVNFGVLFVALTYLLYKPTMRTLDERRAKVAKGVEDAIAAEKKLAEADEEVGEKLKGAETEAEGIVASAREAATGEKARIVKEAEGRAASIEAESEARAREAASRALRESEKEIARLAILAAEKAMRK